MLVRALVFALALPLATSGALPLWAQLAGVEGPHVCHCSVEKHDCVCPKCNPEHEDMLRLSSESLKGRCGDDDVGFGGKAICAVLSSSSTLTPIAARVLVPAPPAPPTPLAPREPPTPPPRSASSPSTLTV